VRAVVKVDEVAVAQGRMWRLWRRGWPALWPMACVGGGDSGDGGEIVGRLEARW